MKGKSQKLNKVKREALIESASKVYNAYLALEFAKTREVIVDNGEKKTLLQWLKTSSIDFTTLPVTKSTKIGGREVSITLEKNTNGTVKINFDIFSAALTGPKKRKKKSAKGSDVKPKKKYKTDEDILWLLGSQCFVLDVKGHSLASAGPSDAVPVVHLGVALQGKGKEQLLIGGEGKLDLYTTHLTTLYNIINHLKNGKKSLDNILIVLATGSGKTFIQALWFLVLHMAGLNLVQSVPGNLTGQFKKDLKRLLPDDLVSKLVEISSSTDALPADGSMIINHELLSDKLQDLLQLDPGNTLFVFDELHLLADQEARKLRLEVLKGKFLTMLLTATPDKPSYQQSGGKPVATMSNKQKQQSGQGVLARVVKVRAKTLQDKLKAEPLFNGKRKVLAALADSIEPETLSAAITGLEHLEHDVFFIDDVQFDSADWRHNNGLLASPKINDRHAHRWRLRWQLQVPMSRKVLMICDDAEECINASNYLNHNGRIENLSNYQVYNTQIFNGPKKLSTGITIVDDKESEVLCFVKNDGGSVCGLGFSYSSEKTKTQAEKLARLAEDEPRTSLAKIGEIIPNFDYRLKKKVGVYNNKNLYDRGPVFDIILSKDDLDDVIGSQYHERKNQDRNKKIVQKGGRVDLPSLSKQIEYNMLHSMINFLLGHLLDMDDMALDIARFNDLGALVRRVRDKVGSQILSFDYFVRLLSYNSKTNPKGIDDKGAAEVAKILECLYVKLRSCAESNSDVLYDFVDNWSLDEKLRMWLFENENLLKTCFDSYAVKHRTLFVMNGIKTDDISIDGGRVFSHFSQDSYHIFEDGKLSDRAKNRERPHRELLSPTALEFQFTPEYTGQAECIADNYAKLGFVGVYVGDRKREGYNDPSLHTVMAVSNRDPDKKLQGFGRNRGLNPLVFPSYYDVDLPDQQEYLDLNEANKKIDYMPQLFSSKKKYIRELQIQIADKVVEAINLGIMENMDNVGRLDDELFRKFVLRVVIKQFTDLNNKNYHDIQLTRHHFAKVLDMVSKKLDAQVRNIKHSYTTSRLIRFVAFVAFRCERYQSNKKKTLSKARKEYYKRSDRDRLKYNGAYLEILNYTRYYHINRLFLALKVVGSNVYKQSSLMVKNIGRLLKADMYNQLDKDIRNFFLPVIAKFFKGQVNFLELAKYHPNWVEIFFQNADLMSQLSKLDMIADHAKAKPIVLNFVRSVPLFGMVTFDDMVDDFASEKSRLEDELGEMLKRRMYGLLENPPINFFMGAEECLEKPLTDLLVELLKSSEFAAVVKMAFTAVDAGNILAFLNGDTNTGKVNSVAKEMLSTLGVFVKDAFVKNAFVEVVNKCLPCFVEVVNKHLPCQVRLATDTISIFHDKLDKIFKGVEPDKDLTTILKVCDRQGLKDYIQQDLLPAFPFDFFKQVLNQVIEYFKESDTCITLLQAVAPKKDATKLREDILWLHRQLAKGQQGLAEIYKKYSKVSDDGLAISDFQSLLSIIFEAIEEIKHCHMYFMCIDDAGLFKYYGSGSMPVNGFRVAQKIAQETANYNNYNDGMFNVFDSFSPGAPSRLFAQIANTASSLSPFSNVAAHAKRPFARHLTNAKRFLVNPFRDTLQKGRVPKWRGVTKDDQRYFDFSGAASFAQDLLATRPMTRADVLATASQPTKTDALADVRAKLKTPATMHAMKVEVQARQTLDAISGQLQSHQYKLSFMGGTKMVVHGKKVSVANNASALFGEIVKARAGQTSYQAALEKVNNKLIDLQQDGSRPKKRYGLFRGRRDKTTTGLYNDCGKTAKEGLQAISPDVCVVNP